MWPLSEPQQRFLLSLARQSIECQLQKLPLPEISNIPPGPLHQPCGAFVTLTQKGRLRGCIGYTASLKPLFETVMDCALSAATQDPRFPPLLPAELSEIQIEISVLSPFFEVRDVSEIQVGTHGLLISRGHHRGLLLPQVATAHHLNREKFLEQTCLKAGLPADAWREPRVHINAFTALVFGEPEHLQPKV